MHRLGIGIGIAVVLISGCAVTYKAPTSQYEAKSTAATKSKVELLKASKQVLVGEGNQITNSDEDAGTISTAPRNLRLTPEQADCGTTMGIDYLKDNRTSTRVAYGVLAQDNNLTVRTNIEGEYKPGDAMQNITLTCVSRGILEKDLVGKILAR